MGSISTRIDTDYSYSKKPSDEICGGTGILQSWVATVVEEEEDAPSDVEVDDDPTVDEPVFGADVKDKAPVEVDDDPTVDEPVLGAAVIEDEDPVEAEVDDDPTVDEPVLGAGDTGILTSWVATEEPKPEDKKGKGGKKKKN